MSTVTLDRVILSWPSLISLQPDGSARRSWIQLAKTGSFVSTRYGKFNITRDDLRSMLNNYTHVTPAAPTELPIDYDHLSMDPKQPGDGIAAGWMKKLELRESGDELWAEVEWTPKAAEAIENKEYQFVSPSFVKNHTHKDGRKIGTTLLAAAITNHPFLENMAALTLADDPVFGGLALAAPSTQENTMTTRPMHLAELGQKVSFKDDKIVTPELTDKERAATYTVETVDGNFVRLVNPDTNKPFGWFHVEQLGPAKAPATAKDPILPTTPAIEEQAAQFSARVAQHHKYTRDWTKAFTLAQGEDEVGATAYRLCGINAAVEEDAAPVLSLSVRTGETFDSLCLRHSVERGISLRDAIHECGRVFPALAAAHEQGTAL